MQDVIFNGTNNRKPASRSSVELVFDNADHRAGGQWGQFLEIAVKRVLTRDGTSSYYINNQPVRRRDVQDVFLGTGLGPRAYAIIGQGTISRIIESKPEELRLFLEEAAGVSKYKERRRETANRLADTRENLTRVEDILRELNANLDKLEKQAEVAARYNTLQASATLKQHQLWFLKRSEAEADQIKVKTDAAQALNDLESRTADLRRVESELETIRQAHYAAGDQVNQAQGKLYEASAEVGKLEAEIRFVVEGRQRVEQRLVQLKEQIASWTTRSQDAVWSWSNWPKRWWRPRRSRSCSPPRAKSRAGPARAGRRLRAAQATRQRTAWQRHAGAAADPGAGRRAAQHRRAEPPVQPAPRTPGRRPQRAGRARRSAPARRAEPAGSGAGSRRGGRRRAARAAGQRAPARRAAPRSPAGGEPGVGETVRPVGPHGGAQGAAGQGQDRRQA